MKLSIPVCLVGLVLASMSGCKPEPEIASYSIPKEASEATTANATPRVSVQPQTPSPESSPSNASAPAGSGNMTALPGMAEQSQGFGEPTWTAPESWVAQPLGSVRKGSWKIPGENGQEADLSVTVFPGDVGGDLANVNRWRRQIGLGPISQAELNSEMEHLDVGDAHGHLVMLNGSRGDSILGVIVPRGGGTWFFKMQGPTGLVQSQRSAFDQFLASVAFPQ